MTAPALRMTVRDLGHGADLLFHCGLGSWRHWTRKVEALAERAVAIYSGGRGVTHRFFGRATLP